MRTKTSPAWGGATSISTICNGCPAANATAALDFMMNSSIYLRYVRTNITILLLLDSVD
jgi:hypothetical protein